jgi:hypothetical protein
MKISPVGTDMFHAFGQTDRHYEANSQFSQFCVCASLTIVSELFKDETSQ